MLKKNKSLETVIRKATDNNEYGKDKMTKYVYSYFKWLADSMNKMEYDVYIVPKFISFKIIDYKYKRMFSTFEAYTYLRKLNVHRKFGDWELTSREDFKAYLDKLLEKYGDLPTINATYRNKAKLDMREMYGTLAEYKYQNNN